MSSDIDLEEVVAHLPEVSCPVCGSKLDAASPAKGNDMPSPGDISLCFYCTAFLEFDNDMKVVAMKDETQKSLQPETLDELLRIRKLIQGNRQPSLH